MCIFDYFVCTKQTKLNPYNIETSVLKPFYVYAFINACVCTYANIVKYTCVCLVDIHQSIYTHRRTHTHSLLFV